MLAARSRRLSLQTTVRLNFNGTKKNYFQDFAARSGRRLFLGRYDGLQANLPLPPTPFSKEKVSRFPGTTTSQVLQIFRWLSATLNNVPLGIARGIQS